MGLIVWNFHYAALDQSYCKNRVAPRSKVSGAKFYEARTTTKAGIWDIGSGTDSTDAAENALDLWPLSRIEGT